MSASSATRIGLRTNRRLAVPAVKDHDCFLSQPGACFQPPSGPLLVIGQYAFRVLTAACYKSGKERASGRLSDRLVAQIEAPPNIIADIAQRRMFGTPMHK